MGFNTAVVVLNDALHEIENDPEFGKKLVKAIVMQDRYRRDGTYNAVSAGSYCNAAEVVSCQHADVPQVVVVRGNTGFTFRYGEPAYEPAVEDLKRVLDDLGYSVRKKPVKKV